MKQKHDEDYIIIICASCTMRLPPFNFLQLVKSCAFIWALGHDRLAKASSCLSPFPGENYTRFEESQAIM